jgi:hypothetical protein
LLSLHILLTDLQRLLQHLEPMADRREGYAQPGVFAVVPGGADAEHGTALGQHIEGGHRLGQQSGIAVGDAGDQHGQRDFLGLSGQKSHRGVALEERIFGGQQSVHLKEVVGQGEHGGAALFGGPRGGGHGRPERLRPARKIEVDEVNA